MMVITCDYQDKQFVWGEKWVNYCEVCEKENCLEKNEESR